MCTLSVFSRPGRLLVTMNRDERRERPERCELATGGSRPAWCYPVDAVSGGTWFGVNSAGLVAALLNRYQDSEELKTPPQRSRGELIPWLLRLECAGHAAGELEHARWRECGPFDLVLIQGRDLWRWYWDGRRLAGTRQALSPAWLLSSSSLDPDRVGSYRQRRFRAFVAATPDPRPAAVLTDLHLRDDPEPRAAIRMQRPGTHTKSLIQAVLGPDRLALHYLHERALPAFDPLRPYAGALHWDPNDVRLLKTT